MYKSIWNYFGFLKPFSKYFTEETKIFLKESLFYEEETIRELLKYSYFVVFSRLTKEYDVVINNEEILSLVKEDYLKDLLGEKGFNKMIQKSKNRR